jgi:hypothetical protein
MRRLHRTLNHIEQFRLHMGRQQPERRREQRHATVGRIALPMSAEGRHSHPARSQPTHPAFRERYGVPIKPGPTPLIVTIAIDVGGVSTPFAARVLR